MLSNKVSVYYLFIGCLVSGIVVFESCYFYFTNNNPNQSENNITSNIQSCPINIKRLNGYKLIEPLMYAKPSCESENLQSVSHDLVKIIDDYKQAGILNTASVYLRVYGHVDWICINDTEKYKPGSLLKVPELITFLRLNELHPGYLNKAYSYNTAFVSNKTAKYISKSIELGKSYTIKELLKYMIQYSDNNATILLNNNMDSKQFKQTFTDFGLPEPDMKASDYPIAIKEYSTFFEALYNAGYLTIEDSEFAIELLSQCDFKQGLVGGLPNNTIIAHKFGEAGNDEMHELNESGIIYLGNKRYLLSVMTKGKEFSKLSEVLKSISRTVYQDINI